MALEGNFPRSKDLIGIINKTGWTLYEIASPRTHLQPFSCEDMEAHGPAIILEPAHHYILSPSQEKGKSLRQTFKDHLGASACLQFFSLEEHTGLDGEAPHDIDGKITYMFSRIVMLSGFIHATTPVKEGYILPTLLVPFPLALSVFSSHLKILTQAEISRATRDKLLKIYLGNGPLEDGTLYEDITTLTTPTTTPD